MDILIFPKETRRSLRVKRRREERKSPLSTRLRRPRFHGCRSLGAYASEALWLWLYRSLPLRVYFGLLSKFLSRDCSFWGAHVYRGGWTPGKRTRRNPIRLIVCYACLSKIQVTLWHRRCIISLRVYVHLVASVFSSVPLSSALFASFFFCPSISSSLGVFFSVEILLSWRVASFLPYLRLKKEFKSLSRVSPAVSLTSINDFSLSLSACLFVRT